MDRIKNEFVIDDGRIESIRENIEPEELHRDLLARIKEYHPSEDFSMIEDAYAVAYEAHKEQKRKNGEPYIIHPLYVSIILADLQMDKETIVAGLLHDVVEDTEWTSEQIAERFGQDVANLVAGVTKLTHEFKYNNKNDEQADNLRNMFVAMARDIRVIIIKLADRLHNMRTLEHMSPAKQIEKSKETMEIYAPLAQRLGISRVKVELDDLAFKYLEPEAYKDLVSQMVMEKESREAYIQDIVVKVRQIVSEAGISARVDGRVKHLFSIYRKMKNQNKALNQIYDLFAVRVIVDNPDDLYVVLGLIHRHYRPMHNRFKDYVANPKGNGYQSIHTTVFDTTAAQTPFEIQIRTIEMHKDAEYGIASHWKYKEQSNGKNVTNKEAEKYEWLRKILECLDEENNEKFLSLVTSDLDILNENIYVNSPKGKTVELPQGSIPIDFAYAIHSDVGNSMIGAKVNNQLVNIDYILQTGDIVDIITGNSNGPSRDWLSKVKTTQAKNKINQFFKRQYKEENIIKGREKCIAYCKSRGLDHEKLICDEYKKRLCEKYSFQNWEALLAAIGHGGVREGQIVNKIQEMYEKDHPHTLTDEELIESIHTNAEKKIKKSSHDGIVVSGVHDVAVRFGKCCNPIPGDKIIGYITRGRGISIHRTDCVNMKVLPEEERVRTINAEWSEEALATEKRLYTADILIYANERNGLLLELTRVLGEKGINIVNLNTNISKSNIGTINIQVQISDQDQLISVMDKLSNVEGVISVERS